MPCAPTRRTHAPGTISRLRWRRRTRSTRALDACRHAIEARPGYPDAYFRMGVIQFERSRPAEASESLRHASASPAFAPSALAYLGTIHARLGQLEPAVGAIRRAAELQAQAALLWMAWNELGKAHYVLGQYAEAGASLRAGDPLSGPGKRKVGLTWALARHMCGERDAARESYRTQRSRSTRSFRWPGITLVWCAPNPPGTTRRPRRSSRRSGFSPGNARAWHELGVNLEAEGRKVEAQNAFPSRRGT